MILPWTLQASTPQLMKASFLPGGTGLPIAFVRPMVLGRALACLTTASAFARPAVTSPLAWLELPPELLLELPQPVAASSAAVSVVSSAAMRQRRMVERR